MEMKEKEILLKDMESIISHSIYVSNLAYYVGEEINLPKDICYELAIAGMLHDIGKLKLSSYLYGRAEGVMTIEEIKYVRMHANLSYDILKAYPISEFVLDAILYHHENYDGSGYPNNLKGVDIPIGARILRVCDVFSALISDRPYREKFDIETAMELLIDEVKNFDMKIFMAFQKVINTKQIIEEGAIHISMDVLEQAFFGEQKIAR